MASTGLADTTRIASANPDLWLDIFLSNRQALGEGIDQLIEKLEQLRTMLSGQERDKLLVLLQRAKATRDDWVASAGGGGGGDDRPKA